MGLKNCRLLFADRSAAPRIDCSRCIAMRNCRVGCVVRVSRVCGGVLAMLFNLQASSHHLPKRICRVSTSQSAQRRPESGGVVGGCVAGGATSRANDQEQSAAQAHDASASKSCDSVGCCARCFASDEEVRAPAERCRVLHDAIETLLPALTTTTTSRTRRPRRSCGRRCNSCRFSSAITALYSAKASHPWRRLPRCGLAR
jgi:hypothetical protein